MLCGGLQGCRSFSTPSASALVNSAGMADVDVINAAKAEPCELALTLSTGLMRDASGVVVNGPPLSGSGAS